HAGDDRGREHPQQRHCAEPGVDGRDRPRHEHVRRTLARVGLRAASRAEYARVHAVRDALFRADVARGRARRLHERPPRRDGTRRQAHLPAHSEGRSREPELRLASRSARRRAAESDLRRAALSARAGAPLRRSTRAAAAAGAATGSAGRAAATPGRQRIAKSRPRYDDSAASTGCAVRAQTLDRRRQLVSPGPDDELIAVRIFHDGKRPPRLLLRLRHELDPALAQLAVSRCDVVAGERAGEEAADAILVPFGSEQHDPRLRIADAQLDPALLLVELLVGDDAKTELLRVELQGARLVADGNARELEVRDHGRSALPY